MRGNEGAGRLRRIAVGLLALGVMSSGLVLAAAAPSSAVPDKDGDGVGESSQTRYVLDEKARMVRVTSKVTVTNQQASTGATYYFLTGHGLPLPNGARDIKAKSNGAKLPVRTEKFKGTGIKVASVDFANLYYGKTRTVTYTYTMPSAEIRDEKNRIRIGEGYAVFPVIGVGDDNEVTVEIVLPKSMDFSASSGRFKKKTKGQTTTWRAKGDWIEAGVSARDPKIYDERSVSIGDTKVSLQSFPGDKEWLDFASKQTEIGLPVLEKITGQKWPGGLDTIREDVSSEALGYAWFDSDADEIVVSEDLDAAILYHEMTHAWINPDTVEGRWLYEGMTETIAQRAAKETGAEGQKFDPAKRKGKEAFALTRWDTGKGASIDTDAYAYPAAFEAVSSMVEGLSEEEFAALVSSMYEGRTAYDRPADEPAGGLTGWTRFLDLVEQHDSDGSAQKALRKWVLTGAQAKQLEARSQARKAYAEIDRANGSWAPPAGLRAPMEVWNFEDAESVAGLIEELNTGATEIQAAAKEADLPVSSAAREAYETANLASEYGSLADTLHRGAEVTTEVGAASKLVDGFSNPVTELGEVVLFLDAAGARQDLDSGHLDDAAAAAAGIQERAKWAFWAGLVALLVLVAVAYALFRVLRSGWARRRRAARRQRRAARKAFLAQVKETKKAGAPWDRPAPPMPPMQPGPPGPPGPPGSVGGELFGVQRSPYGPGGVEQFRRDDLGVQVEQRQELRRFLRDPSADQE